MKVLAYSCVTPGYDKKVKDGRRYVTLPKEIYDRFKSTRMIARMVKALPHRFFETEDIDACLWIDSNIRFRRGYGINSLLEEYFLETEHCAAFAHTARSNIDQEVRQINRHRRDYPNLTAKHLGRKGKLAWTGILYRTFTPEVIKANERWWSELSTKSSRDQLSFPYVFEGLVDYKTNPDLDIMGTNCWRSNTRWFQLKHLNQKKNF